MNDIVKKNGEEVLGYLSDGLIELIVILWSINYWIYSNIQLKLRRIMKKVESFQTNLFNICLRIFIIKFYLSYCNAQITFMRYFTYRLIIQNDVYYICTLIWFSFSKIMPIFLNSIEIIKVCKTIQSLIELSNFLSLDHLLKR